jgi:hypothetical protein
MYTHTYIQTHTHIIYNNNSKCIRGIHPRRADVYEQAGKPTWPNSPIKLDDTMSPLLEWLGSFRAVFLGPTLSSFGGILLAGDITFLLVVLSEKSHEVFCNPSFVSASYANGSCKASSPVVEASFSWPSCEFCESCESPPGRFSPTTKGICPLPYRLGGIFENW